ncbi:hypothetical protein H112_06947 [Trichophyton rubrum D6]|nr:uncharacterized protein TERG_02291 [Trichophyton rubrum CBS 118892]EZF12028.1 hypothetical protein H100_06970 [Trichophyton rubrum MR850]EZF38858.1 hypothetical protein H102_06931 [Trichophyton rubrum CBS 100081]EZF49574.1 hypothetical protein H103_06955 [Trichophyton rubrum CBS 288.86]EZF60201.1 hypothetical protein H104_06910 [Trichophyton rubrum CBS 289.86]EZF70724.1 hypothetical protein H105_06969 [Trichophyton soudanense CBS 452.61]EZF81386.1 hypothetical protein H110_06951 [Trichophy
MVPWLRSMRVSPPNAETPVNILSKLPLELWALIMSQIRYQKDLRNLCLACKYLNNIALPVLYNHVTVKHPKFTTYLGLSGTLAAQIEQLPLQHLKHTKHLSFTQPELLLLPSSPRSGSRDTITAEEFKKGIMKAISTLALAIPRDGLRSFSWDLGPCLPCEIFSSERGLFTNQRQIKSINLVTCVMHYETLDFPIDISHLRNLRSLTYTSPWYPADLKLIQRFLQLRHQLSTLELQIGPIAPEIAILGHDTFDVKDLLLGNQEVGESQPFFNLETLSLRLSLNHMEADIVSALNLDCLRCVKLHNCNGTSNFLDALSNSTQSLKLGSFQLTFAPSRPDDHRSPEILSAALARFLMAFQTLEDLYLSIPRISLKAIECRTIQNHYPALRRLLLHGTIRLEDPSSYPVEISDDLFYALLTGCPVECLSLRMQLRIPIEKWQKLSPRPSCKLLQIRRAGFRENITDDNSEGGLGELSFGEGMRLDDDDIPTVENLRNSKKPTILSLLEFAEWAFSDDGLPKLQVLVWGTFTREITFMNSQLYFCRSEDTFKSLTRADHYAWDILHENMDMLSFTYPVI